MERTARQDRMVMEGYEAHIYSHVDTPQVTLHYHADFFEIYCLLEGSVLYQVERRQYALTRAYRRQQAIPPHVSVDSAG